MAEAEVAQVFQNLAVEMSNVSTALGAQGINQIITPYEGDPKKFKEWVKSIEKYAVSANLGNDDRIKRVAYQASRGPVSEFIRRYQGNKLRGTNLRLNLTLGFLKLLMHSMLSCCLGKSSRNLEKRSRCMLRGF